MKLEFHSIRKRCKKIKISSVTSQAHLSVAPPIDVDGGRSHHGRVLHLSGVRAVLEDPVTVPARQTDRQTDSVDDDDDDAPSGNS